MTIESKCSPSEFIIYELVGRRFFAAPASSLSLRKEGMARFPTNTPRLKIVWLLLEILVRLRLDLLLFKRTTSLFEGLEIDDVLNRIAVAMDLPLAQAIVAWSYHTKRRRAYLHLFDAQKRCFAFVKVALGAEGIQRLEKEVRASKLVSMLEGDGFRIPRLLSVGSLDGGMFAVFQPMPGSARSVPSDSTGYPEKCVARYSGVRRSIAGSRIGSLSWWKECERDLAESAPRFLEEIRASLDGDIALALVHSDISPMNVFIDGGDTWIVDWETSYPDGPALVDEMRFYLAAETPATLRDPVSSLKRFSKRYLGAQSGFNRTDVLLALALCHALGFVEARLLVKTWFSDGSCGSL